MTTPSWKAGALFTMLLSDGRLGACRIIRGPVEDKGFLVSCCDWVGDQTPALDNPALLNILNLNHHAWNDRPELFWADEEMPESFDFIGIIPLTAKEKKLDSNSYGSWESMTYQALAQWRWDNDREAVLKEDAIEEEKKKKQRIINEQAHQKYLDNLTLDVLLAKTHFESWDEFVEPHHLAASRALIKDTIELLMNAGDDPDESKRMAALEACIEGFNSLDAEDSFIMTIEREDICEVFYEIASVCGMDHHEDLADNWRDW